MRGEGRGEERRGMERRGVAGEERKRRGEDWEDETRGDEETGGERR